jgi:hypothetical protein
MEELQEKAENDLKQIREMVSCLYEPSLLILHPQFVMGTCTHATCGQGAEILPQKIGGGRS